MDHEVPPYHDISSLASCQGQREPVDFNGQRSDAGDLLLLPGFLRDFHNKRSDVVAGAGLSEDVRAGARDVESHAVEGDVVAVTGDHAGPERGRYALVDTVDDFAFAVSGARHLLAVHSAASLALTFLLLAGEEGLLHLVVEVLMEAPAPGHGDALVAAVHEAFVAHAALPAPLRAFHRGVDAAAGLAAALGADLVVAVCRTRNTCRKARRRVRSKETTGRIRQFSGNIRDTVVPGDEVHQT